MCVSIFIHVRLFYIIPATADPRRKPVAATTTIYSKYSVYTLNLGTGYMVTIALRDCVYGRSRSFYGLLCGLFEEKNFVPSTRWW